MKEFPERINRKDSMETLKTNQQGLIEETRITFTDAIDKTLAKSIKTVTLNFDQRLWPENRKIIIGELLDRYGEIYISTTSSDNVIGSKYTSKKPINDLTNVSESSNICNIQIDFL